MKYDLFIQKFKTIELLLPKIEDYPNDANFKWYEDLQTDTLKKNKMYYCRITRNYIQHNPDFASFLLISDGLLNFLDEIILELKSKLTNISDVATSYRKMVKCEITDKAFDVLELMNKKEIELIPVVEDGVLKQVIDIYTISNFVSKNTKTKKIKDILESNKINKKGFTIMKKDEELSSVLKEFESSFYSKNSLKVIYFTENGYSSEKLTGCIYEKDLYIIKKYLQK